MSKIVILPASFHKIHNFGCHETIFLQASEDILQFVLANYFVRIQCFKNILLGLISFGNQYLETFPETKKKTSQIS